jgi:tetratricopeptide (TPR) repeat protein
MKRLIVTLAALALVIGACSPRDESESRGGPLTRLAEPEDALSEPLMVALAQARNFHHKADVLLQQGKLDDAVAAVRAILTIDFPADTPESEEVILDAHARLAKLLVSTGQVDEALAVVDAGATLLDESDADGARAARVEAITAYDRSIAINQALMKQLAAEGQR